jgi:hypothetical protein
MEYARVKPELVERNIGSVGVKGAGGTLALRKDTFYPMWQPEELDGKEFDTIILAYGDAYVVCGDYLDWFTERQKHAQVAMDELERLGEKFKEQLEDISRDGYDAIDAIADVLTAYQYVVLPKGVYEDLTTERALLSRYHHALCRAGVDTPADLGRVKREVEMYYMCFEKDGQDG